MREFWARFIATPMKSYRVLRVGVDRAKEGSDRSVKTIHIPVKPATLGDKLGYGKKIRVRRIKHIKVEVKDDES